MVALCLNIVAIGEGIREHTEREIDTQATLNLGKELRQHRQQPCVRAPTGLLVLNLEEILSTIAGQSNDNPKRLETTVGAQTFDLKANEICEVDLKCHSQQMT